jgi:hypothetical protein
MTKEEAIKRLAKRLEQEFTIPYWDPPNYPQRAENILTFAEEMLRMRHCPEKLLRELDWDKRKL